jgi:protein-S-isoprenylcysteine O-methyltransferase Ste14
MPVIVVLVAIGAWIVFEILLIARDRRHDRGRADADQGTRVLNGLLVVGPVIVAGDLSANVSVLELPGTAWFRWTGLVLVCLGFALRVWAITTLGSSFRTSVEVDRDQPVVTTGPYRWVRHPSYSGMLLITLGFGLALVSWISLALCTVLPCVALVHRIRVEEPELVRVLGEPYRTYQAQTKRLVPGVW